MEFLRHFTCNMNITYYVNQKNLVYLGMCFSPYVWVLSEWPILVVVRFFGGIGYLREDTSRGHPCLAATFGVKMAVVVGLSFKSRIDHWGEPKHPPGYWHYISHSILKIIPRVYVEDDVPFPVWLDMLVSGRVMVLKRLLYKDSK